MHVLIVEDSDDDFEATLRALDLDKVGGVKISRSLGGQNAWELLLAQSSNDEQASDQNCQFVILDLNMPGLDGRGLLSKMKAHDRIKLIPVAVLSTSDDKSDVDACYRKGANAFIRKPVNWEDFVKKMSSLKAFWFQQAELPSWR
ncbi:response regulator [Roseobacter litoralis]|uniref:Response regulator n=1 Tax=Roseobacter litoralis (strain ATCC 49566 / DSM 6996 / JCM 21268 / NBRC 15278 / OCh 149) TaxID=391595 RepID=F7ZIN3_ROSLO|nr:response regulator [Roseobacter litoralis]AEI93752.1 putative response regulator [Roseobacter litoralis Och 149]